MKTKKENLELALRMVKEVDSLNETYLKMPEFTDYSVPVLRSAQACEMLLLVLLQDKGIIVEDDGRVICDGKPMTVFGYCAKNEYIWLIITLCEEKNGLKPYIY